MPRGRINEGVSVSFHYFEKGERNDEGAWKPTTFSKEEFAAFSARMAAQPIPNLKEDKDFTGVKFGKLVPLHDIESINDSTIFGRFRSAYWGHSYENSDKGKIAAQSLNMRDFYFVIYYSETGIIYLGCQYLGNYGDYSSLKNTIIRHLGVKSSSLKVNSIMSDHEDFKNTVPVEVKVSLSSKNKDIAGASIFNSGSMIAFRNGGKDDEFELTVREKLLSLVGNPVADIKKSVAKLLSENQIFSVDDEDVLDCTVLVRKKKVGSTKTIYLFGDGSRATRFQLDVDLDKVDGIPIAASAKKAMLQKLQDEIISKMLADD